MADLTDLERSAQRRIVGMVVARVNAVLASDGMALWRAEAESPTLTGDLDVLGVPHIAGRALKPPGQWETKVVWGTEAVLDLDGVAALGQWFPKLEQAYAAIPADSPALRKFVFFDVTPEAVAVTRASWAMSWPWWSKTAMKRAGFLCADCGKDPRPETEAAYRLAKANGRKSYFCQPCATVRNPLIGGG